MMIYAFRNYFPCIDPFPIKQKSKTKRVLSHPPSRSDGLKYYSRNNAMSYALCYVRSRPFETARLSLLCARWSHCHNMMMLRALYSPTNGTGFPNNLIKDGSTDVNRVCQANEGLDPTKKSFCRLQVGACNVIRLLYSKNNARISVRHHRVAGTSDII